jgi:hypothetical protein
MSKLQLGDLQWAALAKPRPYTVLLLWDINEMPVETRAFHVRAKSVAQAKFFAHFEAKKMLREEDCEEVEHEVLAVYRYHIEDFKDGDCS